MALKPPTQICTLWTQNGSLASNIDSALNMNIDIYIAHVLRWQMPCYKLSKMTSGYPSTKCRRYHVMLPSYLCFLFVVVAIINIIPLFVTCNILQFNEKKEEHGVETTPVSARRNIEKKKKGLYTFMFIYLYIAFLYNLIKKSYMFIYLFICSPHYLKKNKKCEVFAIGKKMGFDCGPIVAVIETVFDLLNRHQKHKNVYVFFSVEKKDGKNSNNIGKKNVRIKKIKWIIKKKKRVERKKKKIKNKKENKEKKKGLEKNKKNDILRKKKKKKESSK
ncbi:hypothetical protein RFI_03140 [Reticulomyxa filosa]|uniref:Uncharacterized protein n=1 Tax=Reticulomyxa filosa TaxID=46433 RepID=X6P8I9_RETFI|nr:hypothetical protein RFI_03140 [Reticulomyxa filosa]|eukprot:ETO33957.1 hypothetical protein RFI_03140 [Reticulomyxa filosa]